ncbi:hypothetical protein IW245_002229 [Longispora fulva]|uniref:Uncharacterized protein n=1 Tax=Longispora fulva TaxID=619741 RepID=A0A8J7KFD2_9ACTN|nr:hypothetical protein [Longispora fulva]
MTKSGLPAASKVGARAAGILEQARPTRPPTG